MSDKRNLDWQPDAPLLLSKEQVAMLLNISVRTVGNLLAQRELVKRKIGARTLIPRSSVESFLRKDHTIEQKERRDETHR